MTSDVPVVAVGADLFAQLEGSGLITRKYEVPAGGSVACTVDARDVYVAAVLTADLAGVTQLDLIEHTPAGAHRIADVPFDPAGVVRSVELGEFLRTVPSAQMKYELVSVEAGGDRSVGVFYFNHTATSSTR